MAPRLEDEIADGAAQGCRDAGSPAAARSSCRSICSAARRTRSRSTSRSSPTASACTSAILDEFGDPVVVRAPPDCLVQIGFDDDDDALFPNDNRIFRGFDFLREYFMFPRKFLGVQADEARLGDAAAAGEVGRHPVRIRRGELAALGRGPQRGCSRSTRRPPSICSRRRPTASRSDRTSTSITSFRTAAGTSTSSRTGSWTSTRTIPAGSEKVPVQPLYSASLEGGAREPNAVLHGAAAAAAAHRRRRSDTDTRSDYTGTDMFISLVEPAGIDDEARDRRAQRARAVLEPAPAPSICRSARAAPTSACSTT